MAQHNTKEFNDEVKLAIDDAISTILGPQVVRALYFHLKEHYDITSDEIPYRLDTLFDALEKTFGVKGALTLGRVIARRFYARMGLKFVELGNYKLQDYLEDAKIDLALSTRMKSQPLCVGAVNQGTNHSATEHIAKSTSLRLQRK